MESRRVFFVAQVKMRGTKEVGGWHSLERFGGEKFCMNF